MESFSIRKYRFLPLLPVACFIVACSLAILIAPYAYAAGATIDDQANVLDASRVQAEAAKLPNTLLIYTTNTFSGDQGSLDQATRNRLTDQASIAMGIDVTQRHLSIQSGTSVKISDSQASDALGAFRANFNGGDYTGATISAIDSLLSALSPNAVTGSNTGTVTVDNSTPYVNNSTTYTQGDPGTADNGGTATGVVIAIVVVGILLLLIIAGVRKGLKDGGDPPDDNNWRGPRGPLGQGEDFERGVIYGGLLAESQEHHHHHHSEPFGNGFGGNNFGGGFDGNNFGGGAGGSFGGGGNTSGGAGGSF